MSEGPRPYVLAEANLKQLTEARPTVAVLPWGATEGHNQHLPHGCDFLQANGFAIRAAELAYARGAKVIVLPAIPFGSDAQQLDQASTIHISTTTAYALLRDIVLSLIVQGIDRLVILNSHGGNEFKPLIRDLQNEFPILIVRVNGFQTAPEVKKATFVDPGDHAGEAETSMIMHLHPHLVQMENAGPGKSIPFDIKALKLPGVWTPRPWSLCQPDTGAGNPFPATAEKGERFFKAVTEQVADLLVALANAKKGDLPYV
jgi:creatinine amidohydrolase